MIKFQRSFIRINYKYSYGLTRNLNKNGPEITKLLATFNFIHIIIDKRLCNGVKTIIIYLICLLPNTLFWRLCLEKAGPQSYLLKYSIRNFVSVLRAFVIMPKTARETSRKIQRCVQEFYSVIEIGCQLFLNFWKKS